MLYVLWGRFQNCKDLYHLLHLRTNGKSEYDAKSSKVSAWHRNLIKRLHLWIIIWDDYLVVYPPPPLLYGIIIHYYVNYNYYMRWYYNYIIIIHCLGIYPLPLLCDWFSCTILLLQKKRTSEWTLWPYLRHPSHQRKRSRWRRLRRRKKSQRGCGSRWEPSRRMRSLRRTRFFRC